MASSWPSDKEPRPGVPAPAWLGMDRETLAPASKLCAGRRGPPPTAEAVSGPRASVDFIQAESFTYPDFFKGYLLPNVPCVFSSAFTQDWGSRKSWVTREGKPNFDHLLGSFGDASVPVANCNVQEYNSNPKEHIPLREYISYWKDYIHGNYSSPKGCLYLKDWHLCRSFPDHQVYTTPVYFSSDWLNEYWDELAVDDYRFVYMGPKGSWTPFHADVFHSYSWSVNICGRKRWLLYPPGQEENLRDYHGNLPYDVTSSALSNIKVYPEYPKCCPAIEVIQEAGEMIFVPSGWHHQVYNLDDTISINHNWMNGCNVATMWRFLQTELCAVQQEIAEWRDTMDDWHQHCQVIMKSCTGIDYKEFYNFLKIIAEKRISLLEKVPATKPLENICSDNPGLDPHHAAFDLSRIADVLESLITNPDFQKLEIDELSLPPKDLFNHLKEIINAASL
ncbi:2-oxoglutarate and iron-dependent oxygenase JMJD4 [Sarcophilus harrisii]|uniref:2-oxoglutarate and iron-dependent oxygenase JMJD4 n=1 Tax=Sarcophilus harrisii TaxID=9305 RepID=G3W4V0_SARHA|nr:2-oxoglutarate and iron-dependent oxygenase JMJD4 [Sarcophilus harrisii]XP_031816300.1 2-oxoglutarate and iron-dependent oxygenase JMJD4 [Sarcophilus harrisii]XP_031816302.1 2-oxoglutarate and iron-dependent oxygenase JMJD4 [Sarcophilus harrisii]